MNFLLIFLLCLPASIPSTYLFIRFISWDKLVKVKPRYIVPMWAHTTTWCGPNNIWKGSKQYTHWAPVSFNLANCQFFWFRLIKKRFLNSVFNIHTALDFALSGEITTFYFWNILHETQSTLPGAPPFFIKKFMDTHLSSPREGGSEGISHTHTQIKYRSRPKFRRRGDICTKLHPQI